MSMQLFSFGHPCEHQLRRTCIGGSSCPLNGYPDIWCCSYIKGKINFKRDKPCEGPRCRWGFTHPTQQQFDAVTQVLNESRPIAAKIDEAEEKELLSFHMDNPHIVDTVQCALHMMRHPPSSCARRVGQLLACAAVKSGESKVFMQLLKTMKKPVDSYILGAYAYLTHGNPPSGPTPQQQQQQQGKEGGGKGKKEKGASIKKEDVAEELKNDMVDLMNAALSQGGHLVDREDQHELQATFLQALRQYPRSNKRRQEQLEAALAKFGNRQMPKEAPKQQGSAATAAAGEGAAAAAATPAIAAAAAGAAATAAATGNAAAPGAADGGATSAAAAGAAAVASEDAKPSHQAAVAAAAATVATGGSTPAATTPTSTAAATPKLPPSHAAPAEPLPVTPKQPPAAVVRGAAATAAMAAKAPPPTSSQPPPQPQPQPQPQPKPHLQSPLSPQTAPTAAAALPATPVPPPPPIVGISRLAALRPTNTAAERGYDPIRTDLPLPDIFILGGLFNLSPNPVNRALLGPATLTAPPQPFILRNNTSSNVHSSGNVGVPPVQQQQQHMLNHPMYGQKQAMPSMQSSYIPVPLSQQQQHQHMQVQMPPTMDHSNSANSMMSHHQRQQQQLMHQPLPHPQPQPQPQVQVQVMQPSPPPASSNGFIDSIFGNLATQPVFDNLDTNQLFKEFDEAWAS